MQKIRLLNHKIPSESTLSRFTVFLFKDSMKNKMNHPLQLWHLSLSYITSQS